MRHDRRSKSGAWRVLAGLCVLVLSASACTSGGRRSAPPTDDTPRGGTLRIAITPDGRPEDPAFLDPQRPYDVFFSYEPELFRCCLVRTLLSYSGRPTEEGGTVLRPDLATDLPEVSPDGLTWTFRLKEGLRYAPPLEDVEITAAEVVRAIQRDEHPPGHLRRQPSRLLSRRGLLLRPDDRGRPHARAGARGSIRASARS